jgi:hypothetical protein
MKIVLSRVRRGGFLRRRVLDGLLRLRRLLLWGLRLLRFGFRGRWLRLCDRIGDPTLCSALDLFLDGGRVHIREAIGGKGRIVGLIFRGRHDLLLAGGWERSLEGNVDDARLWNRQDRGAEKEEEYEKV